MKRNYTVSLLFLMAVAAPFSAHAQSMADYTCYPIFMSRAVTPNILIILDTSGSMNFMAYGYDGSGSDAGYYLPDDFDPNILYYGYFDATSRYNYTGTEFDRDPAGVWNGNFLNWLAMRRVDIARKVLVGGRASSRTGTGDTNLNGEIPLQASRKYFKFYTDSGSYSPYSNQYIYKLSKGNIEVYAITTPANFNYAGDYKMYCNAYNGHDSLFEDVVFEYQGTSSEDRRSYHVHPRKATEPHGACDYSKYNTGTTLTTLTWVATFAITVDKKEAEEPALFLDSNVAGVLQRVGSRARFGLEFYNYEEGGKIQNYIGSALTNLVTSAETKGCDSWTPLAETVYEGVRYYQQVAPYYVGTDYTVAQANDPFYYQDEGRYVGCGKNFILLITDGESTMDLNVPTSLRDYDGDARDPGTYPDSGSDYLDDVALWAHVNDMRTDNGLDGKQEITTYAVFAFGRGSQLLKDTGKNGGFIDRNGNNRPDLAIEWDENGDGVPDNYLEAPHGNELESKLIDAITAILQRGASGTAVSILSTSSEGEGSLYQAFFKPVVFDGIREVNWLGYLNALMVDPYGNLREDTVSDNALVYDQDKIIRFTIDDESGDTHIARYNDADGDGKADSTTPFETVPLTDLNPQWEAGEILAQRDAATRTIKTWVDVNGNSTVDTGEVIDFIPANADILRPYLDVGTLTEAENVIKFIRGEAVTGYRSRNITIGGTQHVWKLGDIVYSTPTIVGKPMEYYHQYYSDISYAEYFSLWKNRGTTIYVGANDGMLHAFKGGTFFEDDNPATVGIEEHGWYSADEIPATPEAMGAERWAFIPYNLLPHLKWLTDPDYTHVYYVDLKPKVTDVRIFNDDAYHRNGWGTILIGGMRLGGGAYTFAEDFDNNPGTPDETRTFRSAYFVLDITVPNSPVFLGEFTDPHMGFTTSYPAIVRTEETDGFQNPEDDKWFCLVGSGSSDCDGSVTQNGHVFVADLANRQVVQTFQTAEANAFMATPVTVDMNLNYNVETVYIGETYRDAGNVLGKMYRVSTRNNADPDIWAYQTDPLNWTMTTLFSSATPITSSPTASMDEDENVWIYFGTGKYLSNDDKTDVTNQYFYGIKEPCNFGECAPADEVLQANLYNSTNVMILTNKEVINATATTWDPFVDEVQANDGWYINLSEPGERVLNRPSVLGGVILFTAFKPESDLCGYGGTGSLYGLYYETGTAYYEPILGTETYGDEDLSVEKVDLDKGVTSEIGLHVGQKATSTGFIQQSTGAVMQVDIDPALNIKSGIIGWQQY